MLNASINYDDVARIEVCKQNEGEFNHLVIWIWFADGKCDVIHFRPPSTERIKVELSEQVV